MEKIQNLKSIAARICNGFISALFPYKCLVCGAFFDPPPTDPSLPQNLTDEPRPDSTAGFQTLMGPFLCRTCSADFEPIESPICTCCGVMFESREGDDHMCGPCLEKSKKFRIARASGVYGEVPRKVIHRFKYESKIQLAKPLGSLLYATFLRYWDQKDVDLVIPVPLHIKRLRNRGFNQAYLLIRDWPCFKKSPDSDARPGIAREILIRNRWTEPQVKVGGYKERRSNIKNAFSVVDESAIKERNVLLVDDVFTTGATAEECARALLKSGAGRVDVLTLARTN